MARTAEEVDIPLLVERSGHGDLRTQVAEQLRGALRGGAFAVGGRLPSSRALAAHLGVSRATVVAALAELEGEGWVEPRHGSGTYVAVGVGPTDTGGRVVTAGPASAARGPIRPDPARTSGRGRVVDLTPGLPDTTGLVDPAWRRAWREAASAPVPAEDPTPAGRRDLREALAAHVRRARGLDCSADDVLVTAGTGDALRLLADAAGLAGGAVLVEEPGYPSGRDVLRLAGARLAPVPVDDDGVVVTALREAPADARALVLTPSHQYPLGGRLPVDRRLEVLRWAEDRGALVVEDDYDGEFRYGAPPLPALAALDRADRVAYVGTMSKVLSPGLRLGFVVAARPLVEAAVAVREVTGTPVAEQVQRAMASYVGAGALRRHVARRRRLYAERRARLAARLLALPALVEVLGLDAGLHAVVTLPRDVRAADVVEGMGERGVVVADLDDYRMTADPTRPGLVIGYGHAPAADLDRAVDALAAVLRPIRLSTGARRPRGADGRQRARAARTP